MQYSRKKLDKKKKKSNLNADIPSLEDDQEYKPYKPSANQLADQIVSEEASLDAVTFTD